MPKAGCTLPALLLFCLFFCTPSRRSDLVLSRLASASPAVRTTPSYGVNLVGIDTPEEHSTTATSDSISVMFRPRKRFSQLRRTPRADPDVAEELLPSGTLRGAGSAPARTKAEGAGSRTRKVVLRLTTVSSLHRNPDGSVVCGEGAHRGEACRRNEGAVLRLPLCIERVNQGGSVTLRKSAVCFLVWKTIPSCSVQKGQGESASSLPASLLLAQRYTVRLSAQLAVKECQVDCAPCSPQRVHARHTPDRGPCRYTWYRLCPGHMLANARQAPNAFMSGCSKGRLACML